MFDAAAVIVALLQFHDLLRTTIIVFAAGTPLLLVIMLLHKWLTERREKLFTRCKHRYLSACYRYLADGAEVPRPKKRRDFIALADVLIYLLNEKAAQDHARIQHLAISLHVADHLRDLATSKSSWTTRIIAVEKLGFLRLPDCGPLYRKILQREQEPHLYAKALWALSQIATRDDLRLMNGILASRPVYSSKFNELLYWNVIASFRRRGAEVELLDCIREMLADPDLQLQLKHDLVEACGGAGLRESLPLVRAACMKHAMEPGMRIACLRAIGLLGGDADGALTAHAFADSDWRVRAVAARYAAQTPKVNIPLLSRLLRDQNYHVRLNAAVALGAMGAEGKAMLRQQLTSQDRFARDVSAYILEDAAHG